MPSLFSKSSYKKRQWTGGLKRNANFQNLYSFKRVVKKKKPMGLNKTYKSRGLMAWNPKTIGKVKGIKYKELHWSSKGAKRTKQQQLWYRDRAKRAWKKRYYGFERY